MPGVMLIIQVYAKNTILKRTIGNTACFADCSKRQKVSGCPTNIHESKGFYFKLQARKAPIETPCITSIGLDKKFVCNVLYQASLRLVFIVAT